MTAATQMTVSATVLPAPVRVGEMRGIGERIIDKRDVTIDGGPSQKDAKLVWPGDPPTIVVRIDRQHCRYMIRTITW